LNKSVLLGLCLIATPMIASAQGPVGGSEGPGIEFYSTTTGLEKDLAASARRNLTAGENPSPSPDAEEATARSHPTKIILTPPAFEQKPAAPTTADFLRRR
jgi:hypothetical protein